METLKKYWTFIAIIFFLSALIRIEIAFLILSSIILFLSFYYYYAIKNIEQNGVETRGEILFYNRDDENYKTPVIRFYVDGIEIQKEPFYYASTDLSKIRSYKDNINQSVSIKYNKENPEEFIICSEREFSWFAQIFTILVALVLLSISISGLLGYINFSK